MAPLYETSNARSAEQLEEMMRLERMEVCVFCPGELTGPEGQRILYRTDWWLVTPNRYPYRGTRLHLLLVPRVHVAELLDLEEAQLADLWVALRWVRGNYDLSHYGLGVRSGSAKRTGGTVEHLHVHLIVGDTEDPNHEPVKLKLSSRPSSGAGTANFHPSPGCDR